MIQATQSLRPIQARRASRRQNAPQTVHEDSLRALEKVLGREDAGPAYRSQLQRYARLLATEIEEEESGQGLFGEVLAVDPGLGHRVKALRGDHEELLRCLNGLIDVLGRAPADSAVCWKARRALLSKLRAHRRAEERLLLEAHFQDLGGEGF